MKGVRVGDVVRVSWNEDGTDHQEARVTKVDAQGRVQMAMWFHAGWMMPDGVTSFCPCDCAGTSRSTSRWAEEHSA